MKILPLITLLLVATPAFAQTRIYTNADLGQHPVTWTRTVTPAELAGLEARQFHLPSLPPAPDVMIVPHDPNWPFQTSTLDAINTPLFQPWYMSAYVGRGYGGGYGRSVRSYSTSNVASGIRRESNRPVAPRPRPRR
jgi:hypothetical protein